MKLRVAGLAVALGCASAPTRDPGACATPADRAEVLQVQLGRSRESLANDLLAQCRKGASMESLQDRYSEAPAGSVVIGRQAKVPFKAVALCLQKNECALVRSSAAFHVLKRIG